jgi:hypothetical protein
MATPINLFRASGIWIPPSGWTGSSRHWFRIGIASELLTFCRFTHRFTQKLDPLLQSFCNIPCCRINWKIGQQRLQQT